MANIAVQQNLSVNLRRLAAQRQLYSVAKRVSAVQAFLAGVTPVASAVVVAFNPDAAIWSALIGIVLPILDTAALDPWQERFREQGAKVQEEFDCDVLDIPWNDALVGSRVSPEDVHEFAKKLVPSPKAPLKDWYPAVIDALPLYQARIICQRTSCWWDAKLRRRYATGILIALSVISLVVFVLGLLNGMTLEKFVLAVLAPLAPALLWGVREVQRQKDAAEALDHLKDYGRTLWDRLVAKTMNDVEANRISRSLQDAIFVRRRENPFVFDWVYARLRNAYEEQMTAGAQAMVNEIK